tara:strand:- start:1366 stop:1542 length:177 start_codon:yes stop_codon:yes gene_type:complete
MTDYLKYIIDLLIKEKEEEQTVDERPSIQLEIQDYYITNQDKKQDEEEEKSSVIIIDL